MVQWLRLHISTAGGTGSIPCGANQDAAWSGQKKRKKLGSAFIVGGERAVFQISSVGDCRVLLCWLVFIMSLTGLKADSS